MRSKAKRCNPYRKQDPRPLEVELCEILSGYCGERGDTEGAIETLERIIRERDALLRRFIRAAISEDLKASLLESVRL